jgi:hypothetical protein
MARRSAWRYRLYGLDIDSDRPLRDLPTSAAVGAPDVRVEFAGVGSFSRPCGCALVEEYLEGPAGGAVAGRRLWTWSTPDGEAVELELFGRGREVWFVISPDRRHVRATWSANAPADDVLPVFLGALLTTLLRLGGQPCLHAGAVAVDAHAIAIVGAAGAGKSTTLGALARRGCAVLADDLVVLNERAGAYTVEPGEASIRMSPEVARSLWGESRDPLRRVFVSAEDKVYAPIAPPGARAALPLAAVYVLAPFADAVVLEPLSGGRAAAVLGSLEGRSTRAGDEQAQRFAQLTRLAAAVAVRAVRRPRDLGRLDELAEAIVADARTVAVRP